VIWDSLSPTLPTSYCRFPFLQSTTLVQFGTELLEGICGNCDVGGGKGRKCIYYSVLINIVFMFVKSTCCFPLVFVSYYKMGI
jgi:hypothetical protein